MVHQLPGTDDVTHCPPVDKGQSLQMSIQFLLPRHGHTNFMYMREPNAHFHVEFSS